MGNNLWLSKLSVGTLALAHLHGQNISTANICEQHLAGKSKLAISYKGR